jgi:hypothetical protein
MDPVVSVTPYTCWNSQPNRSSPVTSTSSVMGEAPYTMARTHEKSVSSTPGAVSSDWITAGTRSMFVMRCRATVSRIADGSTSRSTMVVAPSDRPTSAQPEPAMWNIGITARLTLSAVNRHLSAIPVALLK